MFTDAERLRFFADVNPKDLAGAKTSPEAWDRVVGEVAWELLYRVEPELYERLTRAEKLQPEIETFLPERSQRAIEIGAGAGRLTLLLAPRCDELIAVEPAEPMRRLLERKLSVHDHSNTRVVNGFFDALPAEGGWADLVISCSAFTTAASHGGDVGLKEMERVCAPGGMIAIVWPTDPNWFVERGFSQLRLAEPQVEFRNRRDAEELVEVFFPEAGPAILDERLTFHLSELRSNIPRYLVYKVEH